VPVKIKGIGLDLTMKRLFSIALLNLLLLIPSIFYARPRPDEMKVKISNVSPQVFRMLDRMGFSVEDYRQADLYLLIVPSELEQLRKMGYDPKVVIEDMNQYRQQILSNPDFAQYHDYYSTSLLVDSLRNAYPSLVEKYTYGFSLSGRELYAVKISDDASIDEDEPEISFDGCHHGDEIMGSEVIIRLMRDLCNQYGSDPQITNLVNTREIWFYPFVNPDGRQALVRTNNNGVDINRDWGYMWDQWGGSPFEFSQPETQSIAKWILENQFVFSQSNHGGTEALLYPWSYRPNPSPDDAHIYSIASGYSTNSGYPNLAYSQGYGGLYPINGSAKDYFYGVMGSVGWTLEVSNTKIAPVSEIPVYYGYNKPAMLYLIEMASRGIKGLVTDASSGAPIPAVVWVDSTSTEFWPVYTDPVVGDYHKFLRPGVYSITVTANGYQPLTINNVAIVDTGAAQVNFQLQNDPGTFAYRVISSQIPGNNQSDEGMTPWALGTPDGRNYSIGVNGWVVLDMGVEIQNYPGNDFRVIEGDATAEGYDVRVSDNWLGPWTPIGSGIGTAEFDLAAPGLPQSRYIRIEDDGDGNPNLANAGFDLDAVEGRLIPSSGPYLAATGYSIADSLTNFNRVLEAGETANLDLIVQNLGVDPATNVSMKLSTTSQYLTILVDSLFAGDLNSSSVDSVSGFEISAASGTPHNSQIEVEVTFFADNGYQVSHPMVVEVREGARIFTQSNQIQFDPTFVNGESAKPLVIVNNGPDTLQINAMFSNTSFFSVATGQITVSPAGSTSVDVTFMPADTVQYVDTLTISNNDPQNFEYKIELLGEGIFEPDISINVDSISVTLQQTDSVDFLFSLQNAGAGELSFSNRIVNYSPVTSEDDPRGGGGDAFGHIWMDSDDSNGPLYNWVDISDGSGTQIALSGSDMISNVISVGFSVPFYNDSYSNLRVCTNGWLSFTTFSVAPNNTNLPNTLAPRSLIAPLWDDLVFQNNSTAYYRQDAGRFIVQWDEVYTQSGYGPYTFEVIIFDDGNIIIQYEQLSNIDPAYTVGMQNNDASDGFAIAYNENYIHNELAILIMKRNWVSVTPLDGQIAAGGNESIHVHFKTIAFADGDYWAGLSIVSNDPDEPEFVIPLHMRVSGTLAIGDESGMVPDEVRLFQNYPNPFNPTTTISFQIPEKSLVRMTVYNPLGQIVKLLLNKELGAGEYQILWDSTNEFGQSVPSGIYFYELRAADFSQIKKMILLH
jgi:hypothetical protein